MNVQMNRVARLLIVVVLLILAIPVTRAVEPENEHFLRTWARTDQPVENLHVSRTWMWGPEAFTTAGLEQYLEAPGGYRTVQYFDKARMEITHPDGDSSSPWYVTNGLLVVEMITGVRQVGDARFDDFEPANVNVAGDPDDSTGPTYASFYWLLEAEPLEIGTLVAQRVNRGGTVTYDPALLQRNVGVVYRDEVTDHSIAGPFWEFMNSVGLVSVDGREFVAALFENPVYATGRPITEPYWATVEVGGTPKDVLMQCFERRCLTYTPDNPSGWQVEAGNVGRHYYAWRYGEPGADPPKWGLLDYWSGRENWTEWPTGTKDSADTRWLGNATGYASVIGDEYALQTNDASSAWLAARGGLPEYGDIGLVVRLELVVSASANDAGCVLTRVVTSGDDVQFYALCMQANGNIVAFYYEQIDGVPRTDWLIPPGTVHSDRDPHAWQELVIVARGHDFWITVNNVPIGTYHHEGPLTGQVAVGVQRFGAPGAMVATRFHFDEMYIAAAH